MPWWGEVVSILLRTDNPYGKSTTSTDAATLAIRLLRSFCSRYLDIACSGYACNRLVFLASSITGKCLLAGSLR